ncbi:hypothetical protein ACX80Z_15800 [Arthrobacter sp. TMT4-20]
MSLPAPQIFDRTWSRHQLLAIEAAGESAQENTQHAPARRVLAKYGTCIDRDRIRSMVSQTMGGVEGTYFITAALCHAHLAISFPDLLTDYQRDLLLGPLAAGDAVMASALGAAAA